MKTTKILTEEIEGIKVSSLPTRPTAPNVHGGRGYTATEMKKAFDRLPLFIIERFNSLIDDIEAIGEGSLADAIRTGISDGHTLSCLFCDVTDGTFASYLDVGGKSLAAALAEINARLSIK